MASLTQGVSITHGTAADIPRLEPLWVAVHHRHARSMPELAPYVSDAIANRGGLVLLRMNHATESGGVTQFHTCSNSAAGKPRLRVDYRSSTLINVDDPRPQLGASVRMASVASAEKPSAAAKPVRVMQPKPGKMR